MEHLDRLKAALADRYTIERKLGAGGMATVYLAEDLKHKRKVAVHHRRRPGWNRHSQGPQEPTGRRPRSDNMVDGRVTAMPTATNTGSC